MISTLTKKHSFDAVYDSQKVFRLILEAMSHPARVVSVIKYAEKLYGEHPAFLAIAMTLLDNEVSFNTCDNRLLSDEIASLTLAKKERKELADFVFIHETSDIKTVIEEVKCGTPADPHKNATLVLQNDGAAVFWLSFSGPGIKGRRSVPATRIVRDAVAFRDLQNYEYPQGIDLIFVSNAGELFAITRLTRMETE
jgi:alpha-D-ribose 1-methylphosphonate 5-triphosphate synthase subunit PhnH